MNFFSGKSILLYFFLLIINTSYSQGLSITGTIDANNLTVTGTIQGGVYSGTFNAGTLNNITSVGTLSNLTVTGILSAGTLSGTVSFANTAGSATILGTGRTIGITGDLTYTSPSFNGSSNITAAGTLATVNSAGVGTFGSATQVAQLTTNAKGLVTGITNVTISPANFSGSLSGDVTGTQSATVVGKINGTSLAGLSTGILKNTTATGVPSIAVAGTDYVAPSGTFFLGTTSLAHNRASAAQSLTGITSIDGSAATLTTGRTIAITGDMTYTSPSFDGSGNVTAAGTLATVNSAGVGTFGSATQVAQLTTNAKGLVTGITNVTISPANFSGSLSGDVTGTQSATVVGKINGTSLAGLSTGILKNTTATGVPSIAVAGTDYVAPSGTFFLGTTSLAHNRASAAQSLTGITSIDGSAATLTTGRTIAITGDMTYTSPSFDGSGNITAAGTLATVNSAGVGTFGSATQVAQLTTNAKGLVTGITNVTISPANFSGSLSGDVTGTQSATVVGKINGTSLAGLSTGILKNTTATGVPSIAVAGTDYVAPSGTFFLGTTSLAHNRASAAQALTGITSIDGSAATLTTGRTIAITGDLTYTSPSFDGSGNITAAGTLATVNSAGVGTFGSATQVAQLTTNAKGLVTGITNVTISPSNFSGSLSGDVTGTQSATVVGKINGTSLAGLSTGILKNTTATGIPSIAVAGTDYVAPSGTFFLGTTSLAHNRASAAQSLTGITSIDGSAATLTTGRTIAITGDLTYTSPSFDGSGNVTAAGTLATVNSAGVGTFGSATQVAQLTTNAKGLVTGITNVTISPANFSGSLSGDVTGTQSATVVGKINGTSLAGLSTGILKNTTATGVPSIAVAGTDYVAPSGTFFLGTTSLAHNRASAAQSLTGITSIDGSAATLTTGRTIAITGDMTYTSPSFDGSGNVTAAGTLATVNSAGVGTFGSATQVAQLTTNAKGLVTGITNVTISPANFSGSLSGDVTGTQSATVVGKINGTSLAGLSTGILKNTTATGVPSIAVAGTDYVAPSGTFFLGTTSLALNRASAAQALTGITSIDGSAATLTTGRLINGVSFNGSADITVGADAGTLSGTTLASNVTTSSLTSLGTLSSLTVTNGISAGTISGRITKRVGTVASSATPTPDGNNNDVFTITALAANATFAAPTGTPADGQTLMIRVKDNGTARTLAFNAIYRAGTDISLPTTTTISKTLYLGFVYNAADTKWDLVAKIDGL